MIQSLGCRPCRQSRKRNRAPGQWPVRWPVAEPFLQLLRRILMAQEPLLPVTVPGVNAYAEKSVAAGDTVSLRVTSDQDFLMGVVRLGPSLDCPAASDVQIFDYQPFTKQTQPITPGSYVNIDNNLPPPQEPPSSLTLECWVRPWKLDGWQGLITQFTDPVACGFGLFISATGEVASNGQVAFYVGDGGQKNLDWLNNSSSLLSLYQWAHVVGVWDSQTNSIGARRCSSAPGRVRLRRRVGSATHGSDARWRSGYAGYLQSGSYGSRNSIEIFSAGLANTFARRSAGVLAFERRGRC